MILIKLSRREGSLRCPLWESLGCLLWASRQALPRRRRVLIARQSLTSMLMILPFLCYPLRPCVLGISGHARILQCTLWAGPGCLQWRQEQAALRPRPAYFPWKALTNRYAGCALAQYILSSLQQFLWALWARMHPSIPAMVQPFLDLARIAYIRQR